MESQLLIVILNYLATDVTVDCLNSLSVCPVVLDGRAKVVLWENGTGADAVDTLRDTIDINQWHQWAELLVSPENLGFTGGNNRVIERAQQRGELPDYVLLLNSDTLVTDDALTSLIDFMDRHPQAGIAGSKLLTETGEHQCSPFRFPGIASEFDQGLKLGVVSRLLSDWCVAMPPPEVETPVDWVSGASMILRSKMLAQIGLLDEGFFTYFEDMDLCQRAHQAGWQVWYAPQSRVVHLEGASSGIVKRIVKRRPKFWFQARRRYFIKHVRTYRAACIDAAYIVGFSIWRLRRALQSKPDNEPPNMLLDFIVNCVFFNGFDLPIVQGTDMQQLNQVLAAKRKFDILYVEGPGDVVESFSCWKNNEDVLTETARTYSGQFFEFCQINDLTAYVISYHPEPKRSFNERFLVENKPRLLKEGSGIRYHLSQILYGLQIVAIALRYRPRFIDVTSGVTYWFVLAPLKLFGINIIAHMHNSILPSGTLPNGIGKRVLLALDGWFFRRIAFAALCVSPAIERQINIISGVNYCPVYQFRGQFYRRDFDNPSSPPQHNQKPFIVVFAGRIEHNKGVFDMLEMAEKLRHEDVKFDICGGGPALNDLRDEIARRGLKDNVHIHGQLTRPDLLSVYANGHVVIVPTRSEIGEGLPKVCVEAILLGRPVITTRLSNSLDVLEGAVAEAQPDDVDSFVSVIYYLKNNYAYYQSLCEGCKSLREPFLDGSQGLIAILYQAMLHY